MSFASLLFFSVINVAQEKEHFNRTEKNSADTPAHLVFENIENGIAKGNVSSISRFFSSQIYLSLSNGISGYYSSNQAYYVLEEFFKMNRASTFKFSDMQEDEGSVYATGEYNFTSKSKRESAQVYVSIKHSGKKWKITQITIN